MVDNRMEHIYRKYLTDTVTPEEEKEFMNWVQLPQNELLAKELILMGIHENGLDVTFGDMEARSMIQAIILSDKDLASPAAGLKPAADSLPDSPPVAHRIRFLKTAWLRYAAVLLLIAGTAAFLYHAYRKQPENITGTPKPFQQPDILPGANKAILTLSDGSTIILDSSPNGGLAQQGNTEIIKLDAGSLAYNSGKVTGEILYNTISTPKGGQYQVVLPDGTKVWLNAATSITFPTAFVKERKITVSGEVYLEIATDKNKPFLVTANETRIEVLGTSFNLNAYTDEPTLKTTLINGSIKVAKGDGFEILQPGQQAEVKQQISVTNRVNVEQVIAWKSGVFNFDGTSLEEFMRQISRWYDIDVIYKGNIQQKKFKGKIGRDLVLSEILDILTQFHVKYKLEGRSLIIE